MLFNCIFKSQCFTSMAWQRGFPTSLPPTPPKSKGQLSMGHFFQVENRLLPFLWGVNPDQFLSPKFGAKLLTKYCRINKKNIALQEPKLKKLHQYSFVCVSVFLGQKWGMWMKNQLYQSELCSNFELSYNLNSYFSLFLYFVRSVKRVKSLLKQYGMAWNEGTNLEPQIWLYLQQLHSIALKSARVLNP